MNSLLSVSMKEWHYLILVIYFSDPNLSKSTREFCSIWDLLVHTCTLVCQNFILMSTGLSSCKLEWILNYSKFWIFIVYMNIQCIHVYEYSVYIMNIQCMYGFHFCWLQWQHSLRELDLSWNKATRTNLDRVLQELFHRDQQEFAVLDTVLLCGTNVTVLGLG